MGRFLRDLALFAGFASVVYAACTVAWGLCMPDVLKPNLPYRVGFYGHMHSRVRELPAYRGVDVLFLGSSHAYRGFDTRLYEAEGYRAFNLGSSAQTPLQSLILVDRYIDRLDPRLVVFEVNPPGFTSDGLESAIDLLSNDALDAGAVSMAMRLAHVKVLNTLVYRAFREAFGLDDRFVEPRVRRDDTYVAGGYVERALTRFAGAAGPYEPREWQPRAGQVRAFHRLLARLKERGVEVVLVQAPVTRRRYAVYTNNHAVNAFFRAAGRYYDFNPRLDLPNRYFYDSHHLNQDGVARFNRALIDTLVADGVLPEADNVRLARP